MRAEGFGCYQVTQNGPAILWLLSNWRVAESASRTFHGKNDRYAGQGVMCQLDPKRKGFPPIRVALTHLHNEAAKKKEESEKVATSFAQWMRGVGLKSTIKQVVFEGPPP